MSSETVELGLESLFDFSPKIPTLKPLSNFPAELQRKFRRMKDLEMESAVLVELITAKTQLVLKTSGKHAGWKKREQRAKIKELQNKVKRNDDERVQLARDLCGVVDNQLGKINVIMDQFKSEMKIEDKEPISVSIQIFPTEPMSVSTDEEEPGSKTADKCENQNVTNESSPVMDFPSEEIVNASVDLAFPNGGCTGAASDTNDVMEDNTGDESSEAKYCICRQGEFGDMVLCDGPCEEWYHFECVGLTEEPKEPCWFCTKCDPTRSK